MKKVKKMAFGGMGAPVKNAAQAFTSAGMNVPNLKTGDRSFSSTPTMGRVGTPNFPQGAKDFLAKNVKTLPATTSSRPSFQPVDDLAGIYAAARNQQPVSAPKALIGTPMPFTPSPGQKIPPPPTGLNVQKVDNRPAPPGTPALQRFSSPKGYKQAEGFSSPEMDKQAEAAYRQMQQQKQLANSVGRLPAPSGGPANTGLKPIQQDYQALFDKNMAQAQALPPEARSQFSQQFQRAAAAGDPSTIRPGTTFGTPGGLTPIRAGLMKKGGAVKAYAKGGAVKSSASARADGCAVRGKTKGKMI